MAPLHSAKTDAYDLHAAYVQQGKAVDARDFIRSDHTSIRSCPYDRCIASFASHLVTCGNVSRYIFAFTA